MPPVFSRAFLTAFNIVDGGLLASRATEADPSAMIGELLGGDKSSRLGRGDGYGAQLVETFDPGTEIFDVGLFACPKFGEEGVGVARAFYLGDLFGRENPLGETFIIGPYGFGIDTDRLIIEGYSNGGFAMGDADVEGWVAFQKRLPFGSVGDLRHLGLKASIMEMVPKELVGYHFFAATREEFLFSDALFL